MRVGCEMRVGWVGWGGWVGSAAGRCRCCGAPLPHWQAEGDMGLLWMFFPPILFTSFASHPEMVQPMFIRRYVLESKGVWMHSLPIIFHMASLSHPDMCIQKTIKIL